MKASSSLDLEGYLSSDKITVSKEDRCFAIGSIGV
jgi:hypothetical protein